MAGKAEMAELFQLSLSAVAVTGKVTGAFQLRGPGDPDRYGHSPAGRGAVGRLPVTGEAVQIRDSTAV